MASVQTHLVRICNDVMLGVSHAELEEEPFRDEIVPTTVADILKWQYARALQMYGDLMVDPEVIGAGLDAAKLTRFKDIVRDFVYKVAYSFPAKMRLHPKILNDPPAHAPPDLAAGLAALAHPDGEQPQQALAALKFMRPAFSKYEYTMFHVS
jgi:hypothetical protein